MIKSLQDLGLLISLIMNNKILNTVKKYNMLSLGDTVLVGCSGGADSMLLLSFLISIRDEYSLTLKVAHIEHGIRGQESLDDALFVEEYCKKNNVEFNILHIDAVGEARENSLGIEEYSRNRRYEFFNSIPCDRIATAHNLSDNIETVLMRLGRGTGLKGACGIPPVRDKIIRPLIEISSSEIRQYCNEHNISYRVDSTNLENNYARNKIRNELIPVYKELFPELETALSAFILDACEDYSYIEKSAKLTLDEALENNKLNIQILRKTDASIQKRVINQYFLDNEITLDRIHLNDVFKLVHKNGKIQIKGSVFAVSNEKYLRIADFSKKQFNDSFVKKVLSINEFNRDNVDFYCDCDKIVGNVNIRQKKAGDKIIPANRNCTKTLKKLLNELSVPVEERDCLPVICDDLGVIGIVGVAVDDRVKLTADTKNVLTIQIPLED